MKLLLHIDWAFFNVPAINFKPPGSPEDLPLPDNLKFWADLRKSKKRVSVPRSGDALLDVFDEYDVSLKGAELRVQNYSSGAPAVFKYELARSKRQIMSWELPPRAKSNEQYYSATKEFPSWQEKLAALINSRRQSVLHNIAPTEDRSHPGGYLGQTGWYVSTNSWCTPSPERPPGHEYPFAFDRLRDIRHVALIYITKSPWVSPPERDADFRAFIQKLSSRTNTQPQSAHETIGNWSTDRNEA